MNNYDSPEGFIRAMRGLRREKLRLYGEATSLKNQYDEVLRRFHAGALAGDRARSLACAIRDRLELVRYELVPMVEARIKGLFQEYVEFIRKNGGQFPAAITENRVGVKYPYAGDEQRN